jgi:hypothetical protein
MFLQWEQTTRDTIDFKRTYVDMAGDLVAGLVLSEIVFWYLPAKSGTNKLVIHRDGEQWIACGRKQWWDRARVSPKQFDRAAKLLASIGLIEKRIYKFNGEPTVHVRIVHDKFVELWNAVSGGENSFSPKVNFDVPQRVKTNSTKGEAPYTEITTETTQSSGASPHCAQRKPRTPRKTKAAPAPTPAQQAKACVQEHDLYKAYCAAVFPPIVVTQTNAGRYIEALDILEKNGVTAAQVTAYVAKQRSGFQFVWLPDRLSGLLVSSDVADPAERAQALAREARRRAEQMEQMRARNAMAQGGAT